MTGCGTSSVFAGAQAFWNRRPIRPARGGKLTSVAEGMGVRYGIDPIIFRVGFVLGTIYGGSGVVLYLLAWLLFPRETLAGDRKPTRRPLLFAFAVPLLPVWLAIGGRFALGGFALGVLAFWLLHRNYHHRDLTEVLSTTATGDESMTQAIPTVHLRRPSSADAETGVAVATPGQPGPSGQQEASARPGQAEQPTDDVRTTRIEALVPEEDAPTDRIGRRSSRRRRHRWLTGTTVVLAALTAVLMLGTDTRGTVGTMAVSVGVLGVGMVLGAFLGTGRGLIILAAPLSVVVFVLNLVSWDSPWHGAGSVTERPRAVQDVHSRYQLSLGDITLLLDDLRLAENEQVRTAVLLDAGTVFVRIPPKVDVVAECATRFGNVRCLEQPRGGEHLDRRVVDHGADGPGGGRIELNLVVDTGSVEVIRG